jgi:hypothetical protein
MNRRQAAPEPPASRVGAGAVRATGAIDRRDDVEEGPWS